ncbi:patatin-like phospholipase family protein [Mucilaginibacter sp. UR6-11]|uniref:patatin-like phospholipase family protein n=1 Tax=Mucilaginibacter sp. UR6-11 TaxID=1435644 RepID=UPI001E41832C|nr:patatin-like phospholipase family protein [Mucilaginibacter sp. UR6-11]MCC8425513.1 patatin-like phospholipase family protein [Mucilaginibacter sp. UR6-11]
MIKVGLVLSGGGARSVAHLGVLQGLEDLGIRPGAIAGASAGAVIGALYAAGHSPREILETIKTTASSGFINKIFSGSGLFTVAGLTQLFKDAKLPTHFEDLAMPLWVTATDLLTCQEITLSKGPLYQPLIGSCAVPGIFMPVHFDGGYLADGGILDNLPVRDIRPVCESLIGSNVNKFHPSLSRKMSRLQVLDRCFHLIIAHQVATSATFCDYYLEPDLHRFPMFELKYPDLLFKAGYRAVMQQETNFSDLH